MKINFSKTVLKKLDKTLMAMGDSSFHKIVADEIHLHASTVDLGIVAQKINSGKEVDIPIKMVNQIKAIFASERCPCVGIVRRTVAVILDKAIEADQKKNKKKK